MLEQESTFYIAHQAEYREKYLYKWLIIAEGGLFGIYDTAGDAVTAAQKRFRNNEFLLHRPVDDGMTLEVGPMGVVHLHRPYEAKQPRVKATMTATKGELLSIPHA